ncbi:transmembrane protein, putative [Medicago truncatula]|uniref:Transmembrane protein, putative n=1 Tax=Medicago truncatula TaxID=3880 RepID=G7K696_MEDTR|nr:transmembrane protein, putative [Medicago truncatula]
MQDELGNDYKEAVSVEWIDKCLSLTFKCPCGKGYEVLICANNCYYKLVYKNQYVYSLGEDHLCFYSVLVWINLMFSFVVAFG